ncbi:unnamed protein product [Urochloa humidicola]
MYLPISCLAAVLLLLTGLAPAANAAPGTFVSAGCSPSMYAPNTAFESKLNSLLASISSAASSGATYTTFTSAAAAAGGREELAVSAAGPAPVPAPEQSAAYGLYRCRGDLRPGECASCVRDTVARLAAACPGARAASLQSDGCFVRYGGGLVVRAGSGDGDTSVEAYRRCSAGTSGDAGFLSARGAVLAELQQQGASSSSGGYNYKVSASGPVRGVAQCAGGVSAGDCAACVSRAAAQLAGACGAALAADVYQAQCSVRYWANGSYYRSVRDSGDDVGRTLAIIIGIMAGLALLVVFISFLRKACN